MKAHCCQVSLVQEACWKGIRDSEDRVRKSEGRYFQQRFTRSNICKDWEVAMWLVSLQMRGSVARNYIFSNILEMLWSKTGYFGLFGNKHSLYIILLYPIER